MLRAVAVVALGMFAGCATAPPPSNVGAAIAAIEPAKAIAAIAAPTGAGAEAPRSVLLVSVDGLGAEMLSPDVAPRITAMAASGVRAEWMNPSYPVLTFPNHYTLVTGLRPDRHGVVHNKMEDPTLGRFENRLSADLGEQWWTDGTPVWVSAERAGLPTATYFWPGSDAVIHGTRPTEWKRYDEEVGNAERVDTVLDWLSQPADTRPRFVTLYFSDVDHAAHGFGPHSPQARDAITHVDAMIGQLLDGLRERGVQDLVDVVLVSDHGMQEVPPGHAISTDTMVGPEVARLVADGQSIGFAPLSGREAEAEARLLGRHDNYDCWRKADLPAHWQYGQHRRVPPILCQMHAGWDALAAERFPWRDPQATRGSHGYEPALPSMRAVFIAHGLSFRSGAILPPIDNVDVYPLLMHLLGLPPGPNDGDADALQALRPVRH